MRHQNLAKHFCSNLTHFPRRFANMNSAFESVFERSLAAATSMDLRFDNKTDVAELASDLFRFIYGQCGFGSRCRHIEFLEQFSGLIFVNVHVQISTGRVGVSLRKAPSATVFL